MIVDSQEASLYGPWNTVLQDLFHDFCPPPFCTALPLVNVVDSEEEELDKERDEQVGLYPLPPIKYLLINSVFPPTPPKSLPSSTSLKRKRHSDIAQLRFEIKGVSADDPLKHRDSLLLQVVIKKAVPSCQIFDFLKVMDQTDQQACHAFASYPKIDTFGLVVALGDCWTYREYHRKDLRPSPTSSDLDTPYTISRTCADVEKFFDTPGFAHLERKTSDDAMAALRKRLRVLGSSIV